MRRNRSTLRRSPARIAGLALAWVALATSAKAVTFVTSTPISGDSVPVTLTIADAPEGDAVDVTVSIPDGAGDLLGLFGNAVPESLVPAMAVVDATGVVTQSQFAANQVWKVGGGNVMSPVKQWDWGLRFGSAGSAGGLVSQVALRLTAPGLTAASLTEAFNQGWRFGVRIQSTAGPEGSSKIGVAASQPPQGAPPTIAIASPADGSLLATSEVTVTGSVSGTSPVTVAVNGAPATIDGAGFAAALSLPDGPHTLTATATNGFGSASDAVAVTIDTTPPLVTITAPEPGTLTAAAAVTVTGTVVDASPITGVTVNGAPAALSGSSFTAELSLAIGEQAITAEATDAAGNTGSDATSVTRGVPPAIAITTPLGGFETSEASIAVAGAVTGTPPLTVAVNGIAATVAGESFSATVPLAEGSNMLTASVTAPLGTATDTVSGTRVGGNPMPALAISIAAPPDQAFVSSPVIPVAGVVSDPEAEVSVNGTSAVVTGTQYLAPAVRLDEGVNTLVATAVRDGETATAQVTVTYNEPPRIVISSPRNGSTLRTPETDVEGLVDDVAAHVDVNGVSASVGPGGRFLARAVPLALGENPLLARAVDGFGAIGTDRSRVIRAEDGAGRLRMVLVVPDRRARKTALSDPTVFAPVIAETGEEFAAALAALGFPSALFSPPIEVPAVGFNTLSADLYVFAEAGLVGEPVHIPGFSSQFLAFSESEPLRSLDELAEDLSDINLAPSRMQELLPSDFVANGFARFRFFMGAPN